MKRYLPFLIIAVVLIATMVVASVMLRPKNAGGATASTPFAGSTSATPASAANAIPAATPSATKIPADVSVKVEEYGDYQCPPCGVLYPELKKIEAEYGKRIDFAFRNFPLTKNHKNALPAAQAAEAARLQGRFVKMHDLLYDNQSAWKDLDDPRPTFVKYARDIGLEVKRFARDVEGPEVQQRIAADTQRAESLGIQGTPTILIEGRQLKTETTTPEGIRKGIDVMLARKAGKQ